MNRKHFISSIIPLGLSFETIVTNQHLPHPNLIITTPPYLQKGDIIGITCPAGYITLDEVQPAIEKIKEWGFNVRIGNTVGKKDYTYGGTDEERLQDFQQMLDDKNIKAIMCARGGYGAVRIIDLISFTNFIKYPKWIIGFSDITIFHSHIHTNYGIATIHSKMCNSFLADWSKAEVTQIQAIESIKKCLIGTKMNYTFSSNPNNKNGFAEGILIGGNLKTIETLSATNSDITTNGKILFVEDTGEYLYSIDRMFWNLKRSGKLENLKGLIIGGFKTKTDDSPNDAFGKTLEQIVLEKIKDCTYPVCFDFPVGHQKNNVALKCGIKHQLNIQFNQSELKEVEK